VDRGGAQSNDASFGASISGNGRLVAFQSFASNLVRGDTNATSDVFVHDRKTATTQRVSVNNAGEEGNNFSFGPSINADGRVIAFASVADNLVPWDTNGVTDVFVHDQDGEDDD
jgi:Tol biopolymer transport system component